MDILTDIFADGTLLDLQEDRLKLFLKVSCLKTPFDFLLSAFLWNYFLCWDRWNGDVTPTLDGALLFSSRVGSDLGHESGLV